MGPQISEFSYGYALTYELMQWPGTNLKATPIFPSLRQEGRSGGGYDVEMPSPFGNAFLFLQFKMSHFMTTKGGKEARLGLLSPPYYRFHLTPARTSDQHKLLLEMEKVEEQVYYIAPAFYDYNEFARLYVTKQLWNQSCKVRPSEIGELSDDGPHQIAFKDVSDRSGRTLQEIIRRSGETWKRFKLSSPIELPAITEEARIHELSTQVERNADLHIESYCERVSSELVRLITMRIGPDDDYHVLLQDAGNHPLHRIAYIARMFFGVETFLVSKKLDAP